MTGTAMTEAAEFDKIYKLGVVPDPDQPADDPHRPGRPRLPDRGGEVRRRRRGHRRAAREGPAGPGRHRLASRSPSTCPSMLRKRGVPHEVLNAKQHEREAADRRAGRPQGRRHRRHQHGRPRHRHHARRQRRVPGRRRARAARASTRSRRPRSTRPPGRDALETVKDAGRGRARRGHRASAASTSSAPSGTSRAASTTSCAVAPAVRATRASPGSTCRSRTT